MRWCMGFLHFEGLDMTLLGYLARIADALESIAVSLEVLADGQEMEQEVEQPIDSIDLGLG